MLRFLNKVDETDNCTVKLLDGSPGKKSEDQTSLGTNYSNTSIRLTSVQLVQESC